MMIKVFIDRAYLIAAFLVDHPLQRAIYLTFTYVQPGGACSACDIRRAYTVELSSAMARYAIAS